MIEFCVGWRWVDRENSNFDRIPDLKIVWTFSFFNLFLSSIIFVEDGVILEMVYKIQFQLLFFYLPIFIFIIIFFIIFLMVKTIVEIWPSQMAISMYFLKWRRVL